MGGLPMVRRDGATHVAVSVIHFRDGGDPEEMVLGQGTLEEMEELYRLLPAVSYSGERQAERATFNIVPWEEVVP